MILDWKWNWKWNWKWTDVPGLGLGGKRERNRAEMETLLFDAVAGRDDPQLVEQRPSAPVSRREAEERRPPHRHLENQWPPVT